MYDLCPKDSTDEEVVLPTVPEMCSSSAFEYDDGNDILEIYEQRYKELTGE